MLNQQAFVEQYQASWQEFEQLLDSLESARWWRRQSASSQSVSVSELPRLYALVCQHEALARQRGYSHLMSEYLQSLIVRGYNQLYRARQSFMQRGFNFVFGGFPRAVRRHGGLFWLSVFLFLLPALVFGVGSYLDAGFAENVVGSQQLKNLEAMYTPSELGVRPPDRSNASDFSMFGYYIFNNVGIDFRMFATGLLFGLGTLFFLIFNGVFLGVAAGFLSHPPTASVFWGFVATHSAPELIAMIISSVAGLLLGRAILLPGLLPRRLALVNAAREAVPLIVGAALMTSVAAVIEAWWSSRNLALEVKLVSGAVSWLLTIVYLLWTGRGGRWIDE